MNEIELTVSGMSCDHCAKTVQNLLIDERGVTEVSVDLKSGNVVVKGDSKTNRNQLISAINLSGVYQAQ